VNNFRRNRGPGGPDPGLTREQRRVQLRRMAGTDDGYDRVVDLAREARGLPPAETLPLAVMAGEMIEDILNREYPG
jgi:hypothetical protein